jgi:peptidoglycan hydrolase CwlO-like protein
MCATGAAMKDGLIRMRKSILIGFIGSLALCVAVPTMAAPPASHSATRLQAQLKDLGAKLADAHSRNQNLQAQVARLEQQNAAKQQQVQQRDARIAALQMQLRAAGVPASTTSTGH